MLRLQPEIGPELDDPARPVPVAARRADAAGVRSPPAAAPQPPTRPGALLAAFRRPLRGPVNVAPSGSVSLSRALRLLAARRCRSHTRSSSGRWAALATALAPARSMATPCVSCATAGAWKTVASSRSWGTSPSSLPRRRSATSPLGCEAARSRHCTRAPSPNASREPRRERPGRGRLPGRKPWPTFCAVSATVSRVASTRSPLQREPPPRSPTA